MKRKLKVKTDNVILAVILIASMLDIIYMIINMIKGYMITWFGISTLVINIIFATIAYSELEKEYKKY